MEYIMLKRVSYFLLLLSLYTPYSRTEFFIKKWLNNAFGIDINERLINKPFNPTLTNLNTITLIPCDYAAPEVSLSTSELVSIIDKNALQEGSYLMVPRDAEILYWKVSLGVDALKQQEPVFVYSRGYAGAEKPEQSKNKQKQRGLCSIPKRGGGVVVGAQWLKGKIINGPCVIFDYPDTRSYFDFGLTNDQRSLECIYQAISPKTDKVIFFGNCRGSKALLTYLSRSQPENVAAVILDAPFLDLKQFTKEIEKNYAKRLPFADKIARKIITTWYPHYKAQFDLHINELKHIPKHIPIFIGHLKDDCLVANTMIQNMVKTLRDSGHTVYLLVIDDKTKSHSRLYQTVPFQQTVNAFLKAYNLPHDDLLAQAGKELLQQSHYNAQHIGKERQGFAYIAKT